MNPYLNYSIALLGSNVDGKTNKGYSKIGIGVIINNDYLVFSSFQLSLSYYPTTFKEITSLALMLLKHQISD
jgi:hypothetical protein